MPRLLDPFTLGGLTLRNRIVLSPMQQYSSPDGLATDWHLVHLGSRAVGGAGLLITESTAVTPEGRSTHHDLGLWNDAQVEPWQRIIPFVHQQGARSAVQLGHFGAKAWTLEESVELIQVLKSEGVDFVTASAGGFVFLDKSTVSPGYQVPFAHQIRQRTGVPTGAVGLITTPEAANAMIEAQQADLIVIAREHLRNPYFATQAAVALGQEPTVPFQYKRAYF